MDFLAPIVRRELRIALRRQQLPKERFYVAASGAALVTLYLLLGLSRSLIPDGQPAVLEIVVTEIKDGGAAC